MHKGEFRLPFPFLTGVSMPTTEEFNKLVEEAANTLALNIDKIHEHIAVLSVPTSGVEAVRVIYSKDNDLM